MKPAAAGRGFTLIELLTALLILSLLALMSYRGLGAVMTAREYVTQETEKWRRVSSFFARFERDIQLAAPRPVRSGSGIAPAWRGASPAAEKAAGARLEPRLEFSRFGSAGSADFPQRVAYALNGNRQIELWLWPGLDVTRDAPPARYPVLEEVVKLEFQYLNAELEWVSSWPTSPRDAPLPRAVRLRIVFSTSDEIVRVFALNS
jgi:general secretion pathway protein J